MFISFQGIAPLVSCQDWRKLLKCKRLFLYFTWLSNYSIYRKFKNSLPGALRPESGMVGRGTVAGAAIPALWCLRGRYAQGCGRSHPAGDVKSLEADRLRRPLEAFSRLGSESVWGRRDGGSARGGGGLHGHLGAGESRWHATRPVHLLAVAVQARADSEALPQRRCALPWPLAGHSARPGSSQHSPVDTTDTLRAAPERPGR